MKPGDTPPDLGTCVHGVPMVMPCTACDAARGPLGGLSEYMHEVERLRRVLAEIEAVVKKRVGGCPLCGEGPRPFHTEGCRFDKALP